jgi:hypothetical protein
VDDAIQRIIAAPTQGNPVYGQYRWRQVRQFPYNLYYKMLDPFLIRIYAVAHTSRRPGYWLRRTRP